MAGLDGIERKLEPPPALEGLIYEQPEVENCPPLPRSFDAAIEHLAEDAYLNDAMGEELVRVFLEIKGAELARANAYTTDWEFNEYTHHLRLNKGARHRYSPGGELPLPTITALPFTAPR